MAKTKAKKVSATIPPSDLTKRPPRSPRVRLGGYAILARCLDKCRATIAGTKGEYVYACPLDQRFFDFTGIAPAALKKQVATGKGDWEILQWIYATAKHKHSEAGIAAWSEWQEQRAPSDIDSREFFQGIQSKTAPHRKDITTWFELLDLDDYVSFGGKA